MKEVSREEILKLSKDGALWGTVFGTLGGHNGRGLQGHGRGLPATVEEGGQGTLAVMLDGAFMCAVGPKDKFFIDSKGTISWGSSVTLHVTEEPPAARWERAPL